MSSVTRFLRQRVQGTTTLVGTDNTTLYVFVAGAASTGTTALSLSAASNYVGNYPPGFMIVGPTIATLKTQPGGSLVNPILRDMGKTIYARLAGDATAGTVGTAGFWRQVQVIDPAVVSSPTASTNFGVTGSAPGLRPAGNTGDDGYNTFYIPIEVGGVLPSNTAGTAAITPANVNLVAGNVL